MAGGKYKKNSGSKDEVLEKALKRFEDSWTYAKDNWHKKWDRDNKLYDNERVYASYEGTTDTFVPMVFSTIETMVAEINNANVRFQFKTGNPMTKYDDAAVNGLISEWWDDDDWDLFIEEGSRETFITGMCTGFLSWEGDHPHLEGYAMRDAIVDPTVRKPADLQQPGSYAGRRYFVRKGQLDDYEVVDTDPNSTTYGQLVPRFKKAPDDASPATPGDEDDKQTKEEMYSGSTLSNAKDNQDEIIEIWDVDRVVTIKNRKYVIEDVVNPYKQRHQQKLLDQFLAEGMGPEEAKLRSETECEGIVPFFFLRNYRRMSLLYAKSEVDSIAKEQEYLNDMTNMEGDFLIRQLSPQRELDPLYKDWIDLIDNDPDTVYPFKPGSLVNVDSPVMPPSAFQNRMNIKNEIRETTAIDQVAKGVQNVKDTTATEVQAQLNQSGKRIQSKARIFEKDGFKWWGWILMHMIQLYIDEPLVVEISGGARISKEEALEKYGIELPSNAAVFDPAEFAEVQTVDVSLDVDVENGKAEKQKAAREAFGAIIQDPTNNLPEAKRILYPKMFDLDQDDINAIITPPPQPAMPGMGGPEELMAMAGGAVEPGAMPPEGAPMPPEQGAPVPEEVANV